MVVDIRSVHIMVTHPGTDMVPVIDPIARTGVVMVADITEGMVVDMVVDMVVGTVVGVAMDTTSTVIELIDN